MFRNIFVFWRKCCWFLSAAFMNFVEMRKKKARHVASAGVMKPESKPKIQNPKWPKPTWIAGEFCASDSVLWSRDETVTVVRPGAWKRSRVSALGLETQLKAERRRRDMDSTLAI